MNNLAAKRQQNYVYTLLLLLAALLSSCAPTTAFFSSTAYEQATALKVDALAIMSLATEDYTSHVTEVSEFQLDIDKAIEYAKGRPNNDVSVRLWTLLMDPNRNSLGGFLARWQTDGTLNEVFIDEAKLLVANGFDQIIGLESGKIKASDVNQ